MSEPQTTYWTWKIPCSSGDGEQGNSRNRREMLQRMLGVSQKECTVGGAMLRGGAPALDPPVRD